MTRRFKDLIESLQGTCGSIGDEQDDWGTDELNEFDDAIFCCEWCGWWYGIEEVSNEEDAELICVSCMPNDE